MEDTLRRWTADTLQRLEGDGAAAGWEPIRVEASHRRFRRVTWRRAGAETTFVVMASPPALENNVQFEILAELFAAHGIGVPRVLAADHAAGFFLLSDLGRRHFEEIYHDQGPAAVLPAALETLHRLQRVEDPRIPPYTRARLEDELGIYRTWCLEALLDREAPPGLIEAFHHLVEVIVEQPTCCVHRDFHCRNLLLDPGGGIGVVDFQDALMGPAAYDLASLLHDCYFRFPEPDVARWQDAYLAGTRLDLDPGRFPRDVDYTALQRQLKAVGIFVRLHRRDGRATHLAHVVPVLERIAERAARYAELAALAEHAAAAVPLAVQRLEPRP